MYKIQFMLLMFCIFCAKSILFYMILWCKSVKPNLLVRHYDFILNSKPSRYGKLLMGQLAPLLQLAVKVFKFSRFHTCMVCQLAWITQCLNTMEKNEKRIDGQTNG